MFIFTAILLIKTEQLAKTMSGIEVKRLPSRVVRLSSVIISLSTELTAVIGERSPPAIKITTTTLNMDSPILLFLLIL